MMQMPKPIINRLNPIVGYYIHNPKLVQGDMIGDFKIRNKGYRNFGYWLQTWLAYAGQNLYDTGGASRAVDIADQILAFTSYSGADGRWLINIGGATTPHDVARYELYSRHFVQGPTGFSWLEDGTGVTYWKSYFEYAFPIPDKACGEVGLYHIWGDAPFMLARVIVSPTVNKLSLTVLKDGWQMTFPGNYTRWFLDALYAGRAGGAQTVGRLIRASDGIYYGMREYRQFHGSTDLRLGTDNTTPDPKDWVLKTPLAACLSQNQSVEIDTTLQEIRVVRTGTYTPGATVDVGEIAIYTRVYDGGGTEREIMVCRGIWSPKVTLTGGVPYTLGLAMRLG